MNILMNIELGICKKNKKKPAW